MRRLLLLVLILFGTGACTEIAGPRIAELVLHVDAQKVTCYTLVETECLRVRERESEDWQAFYGDIEGFAWEAGYLFRIRVVRVAVGNPYADGPSARYVLWQVLSKTPAPGVRAQ